MAYHYEIVQGDGESRVFVILPNGRKRYGIIPIPQALKGADRQREDADRPWEGRE